MFFRLGITAWIIFSVLLTFEAYSLNFHPDWSLLNKSTVSVFGLNDRPISPEPGRPLSIFYGTLGLGIMLTMNLYSMRKRVQFLAKILPSIPRMLDFHIFCGLMGPTLILFHSNFKVRGLVAISFWSMIVSASSGVIGRYFYMQILENKADLRNRTDELFVKLENYFKTRLPDLDFEKIVAIYLRLAGIKEGVQVSTLGALSSSLVGDINLNFSSPVTGVPDPAHFTLVEYVGLERKQRYLGQFQRLMGYWHTYHLPFAYFMYGAAVLHVAAALLFGVKK